MRIILDILLVIFALLALYYRPRIGGELASGLRILILGVFLISLTHITDTLLNSWFVIINNAVLHRSLNLIGFIVIFVGFFRMRKAFED